MEEAPKKYRITDKEGADLFLDAIHPADEKKEVKPDETGREMKRLKYKTAGILSIIAVLALVLGAIGYYAVQKYRAESIFISSITAAVTDFEIQAPSGLYLEDDYAASVAKADSLLHVLDMSIAREPEKDTLKTLWASVLLHKYEKYVHFSLKNSLYDGLKKIDTADIIRAQRYNRDYTNLIPIMYSLADFYRFREQYKIPPRLSCIAPKQFDIEALIDKAREVQYIAEKNAVILDVHFPVLSNWINYFANSVIPQVYEWDAFWSKYKDAIGNSNDKLTYQSLMSQLAYEFPNLQILKDCSPATNLNSFRLGMVSNSLTPLMTDVHAELNPFFEYLRKSFGQDMRLILFNDFYDLFQALKSGQVDFAVMDFAASATCFFSGVGLPIAQRSWNRTRYINFGIYGVGQSVSNNYSLASNKIASLINDDYLFYKFFEDGNFNFKQVMGNWLTASCLNDLVNMINSRQCGAVMISDEELHYIQSANLLRVNLVKYKDVGAMPLDIFWARDSIAPSSIKKIQDIMIPVTPADIYGNTSNVAANHTYGDWDPYENAALINYYNDSRKLLVKLNETNNRIHLFPIISESDSASNRLRTALTEYLEETGFKVVDHNNASPASKKPNDNYMTLKVSKDKQGRTTYYVEVHRYDKSGRNVVFREQFQPGQGSQVPDFRNKLFDLASSLNIFGKVTRINGRQIEISTNMEISSAKGKSIYLFKIDQDMNDLDKYYAKLTISDCKKGKIIADIGNTPQAKIKTGDIGVIINGKK